MSQPNPINWFEIPVTDLSRAKKFYEAVFETTFTDMEMGPAKMAMFPAEMGAAGATGGLMLCDGFVPSHEGTLVYFSVASIEVTQAKITSADGKELMPKMAIGEHGHISHFEDSEGNRVALHEAAS